MSASPAAASPAQEVNQGVSGDAEMASVAASPAPQAAQPEGDDGDAGDDDLFGDDDDDQDEPMASKGTPTAGGDDEDDEDEDDIRPTNRRRRKAVASASPARSEDPGRSTVPTFDDDEAIEADGDDEDNASETARLAALEYPEDGEAMGGREASPLEAKRIATVALANTTQRFTPAHLARLPLFLRVEPKVFDEEQFKDKRRDEAAAEAEASAADDERLKDVERRLRCENTVRWKVGPDGKRRSNARFVRWSDGSWTLQVGKEHFDIAGMDARYAPGGQQQDVEPIVPTSSQSQSQGGSLRRGGGATSSKSPQQPLTYLATPDSTSQLFQTLSPLHSNITIQPTSLQSATHRLISQSLSSIRARQSASKVTMSDLAAGERAPEEAKREAERKLLDAERRKRLKKKKERGGDIEAEEEAELMGLLKGRRRTMIDEVSKSSRGKGSGIRRAGGGSTALGADDEEEEEDEGGYDDDADGFIVNDDEDGEEDAEGEEEEDSEEEEGAARKSKSSAGGSKKKAGGGGGSDMDVDEEEKLDPLEKAELEAERKDAARSKAKKEAAAAATSSTDAASATPAEGGDAPTQRKKQAIVDSEDEE